MALKFPPALAAVVLLSSSQTQPGVVVAPRGDTTVFTWKGKPIIEYVGGEGTLPDPAIKPIFKRGGYLHPVYTPSGRIVTADYPEDHRHHHGVWFAWTKTRFQDREPDFWNMGDAKARVEVAGVEGVMNWPGAAGVRARHRYVDLTSGSPIVVLEEEWAVSVLAPTNDRYYLFDVDVEQTNVAQDPLHLPEYHYGGIGVRGAAAFVDTANVRFLTSEGKDRKAGDAGPARWAVMSGNVDGQPSGIAVLAHPSNFRAPEPMRIHPTDPYLCFAPSRSGPWSIAKGGKHTARYRFVSFDGQPDAAELQRLWQDYAKSPSIDVQ